MAHVFISYVRENRVEVDRLCGELTKRGVKVWLDQKNIEPGMRWKQAIRRAIRQGSFFIACFSKEYHERSETYMNEELTLSIEELRKRPHDRVWFIPVKLSECKIPDLGIGAGETLRDIQWVELYRNWDDGIVQILGAMTKSSHTRQVQNGAAAQISGLQKEKISDNPRLEIEKDNEETRGAFIEPSKPSDRVRSNASISNIGSRLRELRERMVKENSRGKIELAVADITPECPECFNELLFSKGEVICTQCGYSKEW